MYFWRMLQEYIHGCIFQTDFSALSLFKYFFFLKLYVEQNQSMQKEWC